MKSRHNNQYDDQDNKGNDEHDDGKGYDGVKMEEKKTQILAPTAFCLKISPTMKHVKAA